MLQRQFEIVLSLTGVSRHTGQTTQSRTSYLSNEIFWGHRFTNVITYDRRHEIYVTHADLLDELNQVDTALCSARRLNEILDEIHDVLDQETVNSLDKFDEEDEDSYSGIQIINRPPTMSNSTAQKS